MPTIALSRDFILHWAANIGWAALILTAGLIVANWASRGTRGLMKRIRGSDPTLAGFLSSLAKWTILAVAGIAALDRMGIYTTSIVAVLGAAGLAVGLALQGTLSNLAAGVMLLLFRPFRAGDSIEAGAIAGTVVEISLVHTVLRTGDNVQITAPNAMLWAGAVRNLSVHPTRQVEIVVPVPLDADPDRVMERLRALVGADGRVASDPAPSVAVAKLGDKIAEISVKAWCEAKQAGSVKADLTAAAWRDCLRPAG